MLSPLMMCAVEGHAEAVDMLVSKKADLSTRGPDGKTALMLAAAAGHTSLLPLLVVHTDTTSHATKASSRVHTLHCFRCPPRGGLCRCSGMGAWLLWPLRPAGWPVATGRSQLPA